MKATFTVNNYQLGAKVRTTPVHKITRQELINKGHTEIEYSDITDRELAFIEKIFARKATRTEQGRT